jgi:hypothetical protein
MSVMCALIKSPGHTFFYPSAMSTRRLPRRAKVLRRRAPLTIRCPRSIAADVGAMPAHHRPAPGFDSLTCYDMGLSWTGAGREEASAIPSPPRKTEERTRAAPEKQTGVDRPLGNLGIRIRCRPGLERRRGRTTLIRPQANTRNTRLDVMMHLAETTDLCLVAARARTYCRYGAADR